MATNKKCPFCGENSVSVKDSRPSSDGNIFWRRVYNCSSCGERFTTTETVVAAKGRQIVPSQQKAAIEFLAIMQSTAGRLFGGGAGHLREPSRPDMLGRKYK